MCILASFTASRALGIGGKVGKVAWIGTGFMYTTIIILTQLKGLVLIFIGFLLLYRISFLLVTCFGTRYD